MPEFEAYCHIIQIMISKSAYHYLISTQDEIYGPTEHFIVLQASLHTSVT